MQDRKKKRERERPKTVDGMMGNEGGTDGEAQRGENKSERMRQTSEGGAADAVSVRKVWLRAEKFFVLIEM